MKLKALTITMLICAFVVASMAQAHDFWIQPDRFNVPQGEPLAWSLLVGHAGDRQFSAIPRARIRRLEMIDINGTIVDLKPKLDAATNLGNGAVIPPKPGVYILALATDHNATNRLPARLFNEYLGLEGLTPALQIRKREGAQNSDGTERYGRCAKAIVRVGATVTQTTDTVTKPVGLSLEIIPLLDPAAMPIGGKLPIQVNFNGKPLPGALVKLTDLDNDVRPVATKRTQRNGQAQFELPRHGSWLLNVVWIEQLPAGENVEFETTFSSLAFQI